MKKYIILFAVILGCGSESGYLEHTSPDGYRVFIPNEVYTHGITYSDHTVTDAETIRVTILYWVDGWVQTWINSHPELTLDHLQTIAAKQTFIIVDHFGILFSGSTDPAESDVPYHGMAHGKNNMAGTITVAIYECESSNGVGWWSDVSYPPHLVKTGADIASWTGDSYWLQWDNVRGYLFRDQRGISSLPHELDHTLKQLYYSYPQG